MKPKPPTCVHRYRLDEPNGPLSLGVCRHCGAERYYKNAEETDWGTKKHCLRCGFVAQNPFTLTSHVQAKHGKAGAA